MSNSPSLLTFKHITKSFGAVRALRGVDFELKAGEVHALLGENGAGKSTLIKIATGAHQADGGEIWIDGEQVVGLTPVEARRRGIACIYQQPALFPDLSVSENIALRLEEGRLARRIDWKARRERAQNYLRKVNAQIDPGTEVGDLSMPEQQLVEIACALGAGAKIVIMDEPTASLTREEQGRLFQIVGDLRREGIGVVYISHRMEEIFALADRVTVLRDGQSIATSPAAGADERQLIAWMVGRELEKRIERGPAPAGQVCLRVHGLGCRATGVKDVSFQLRAGEVLGLGGLVGAGRTELARILFGITPADTGRIEIGGEGRTIRHPAEAIAKGIAYLPEDRRRHGVSLDMTLTENTSAAVLPRLFPHGLIRQAREEALAEDYVRRLGTKTAGVSASVGTLSGGNQQKVALARWLATEPKIFILDEPTQGVDVGAKHEIHRIIADLASKGMAVLLISSDLPELLALSDRVGVMRGGRLVGMLDGDAAPAEVMALALGTREASA